MSVITEQPILLSFSIIKASLYPPLGPDLSYFVTVCSGSSSFRSMASKSRRPKWNFVQSIDLQGLFPLEIKVYSQSYVFIKQEVGVCELPVAMLKKGRLIGSFDLHFKRQKVGSLLLGFMTQVRTAENPYLQLLTNEVDLQRLQVRHAIDSYKAKIERMKEQQNTYRRKVQEHIRRTTGSSTHEEDHSAEYKSQYENVKAERERVQSLTAEVRADLRRVVSEDRTINKKLSIIYKTNKKHQSEHMEIKKHEQNSIVDDKSLPFDIVGENWEGDSSVGWTITEHEELGNLM